MDWWMGIKFNFEFMIILIMQRTYIEIMEIHTLGVFNIKYQMIIWYWLSYYNW